MDADAIYSGPRLKEVIQHGEGMRRAEKKEKKVMYN
jgi:hypothetical protein